MNHYYAHLRIKVSPAESIFNDPENMLPLVAEYVNSIDGLQCEGWITRELDKPHSSSST